MPNRPAFLTLLKATLAPLLRQHTFHGSGARFHRLDGDVLHVVEIQAAGGGGGVHVNLGIHHARLGFMKSATRNVREVTCPFRSRLHDFAGGDMFAYGERAEEVATSVLCLTESMKTEGLVAIFGAFAAEELSGTIKHMARKGYAAFPALSLPAGPATWAQLAKAVGDAGSAKKLAAQQRALGEALKEEARRKALIARLVATSTWVGRTHDCMNEACALLRATHFAAWERALEKTAPAERMDAILPYLQKHHPDIVQRVAGRYALAYGTARQASP